MAKNMEVVSKETIRPSSPTPKHLRCHKLSLLDQLAPPVHIPIVLFYNNNVVNSTMQLSQSLKLSLSETLTRFYPLAGRIGRDNNAASSIDCNDAGVEYVETRLQARLEGILEKPSMEELTQFLPRDPRTIDDVPLSIQVNFFACGGVAIGACISHKVADASSLSNFMNAWAAKCRGDNAARFMQPVFDSAAHFPPSADASLLSTLQWKGTTEEKVVTRRFVFSKEKLAALKKTAAADSRVKDATRVECVTAFMWWYFMAVVAEQHGKTDSDKFLVASHVVNLRSRTDPPLPEQAFGNIWSLSFALPTVVGEREFENLVGELRDALRSVDSNYAKIIQDRDECLALARDIDELCKETKYWVFSSWVRFPLYEVDFGWGTPVWVASVSMPLKNMVILTSTRCGEGIEAWVNMSEEDGVMLRCDLQQRIYH